MPRNVVGEQVAVLSQMRVGDEVVLEDCDHLTTSSRDGACLRMRIPTARWMSMRTERGLLVRRIR